VGAVAVSSNARLEIARVMGRDFAPPPPSGVHHSAVIAPTVDVPESVYIRPYSVIGPGVTLGEGVLIDGGVHIAGPATIGDRVMIHAGSVVGSDGRAAEGSLRSARSRPPGGVEIREDAEIGANTFIAPEISRDTVVEERVKIDNLVHVSENVRIGDDALVGLGSVVRRDAPPGSRVLGNPARPIP